MPVRAKELRFETQLAATGELTAEGCEPLQLDDPWEAEHLLLAALARCSLKSFHYHAKRANLQSTGSATARGLITKRESDGRYAFVEITCRIDVDVDPLSPDAVAELLAKAERDCFVGASLSVEPRYEWQVNGERVSAPASTAR